MRFAPLDRNFTGISVPVAALRTAESCGVGEFGDLVALAAGARRTASISSSSFPSTIRAAPAHPIALFRPLRFIRSTSVSRKSPAWRLSDGN